MKTILEYINKGHIKDDSNDLIILDLLDDDLLSDDGYTGYCDIIWEGQKGHMLYAVNLHEFLSYAIKVVPAISKTQYPSEYFYLYKIPKNTSINNLKKKYKNVKEHFDVTNDFVKIYDEEIKTYINKL